MSVLKQVLRHKVKDTRVIDKNKARVFEDETLKKILSVKRG